MTSPVSSYQSTQPAEIGESSLAGSASASSASARPAADSSATATTHADSATITPAAHLSVLLVDSARSASGVDTAAVSRLRAAVRDDSYNPPAEKVASAIQAAAHEVQKASS